jgi:trimeric autotransporter adhesin
MHTFSRSLLVAGVLAFGTLSAACGDKVTVAGPGGAAGVQLVTVTPPSATIAVGQSIILSGQVTADAASAKTVTWSTSSAAVASVDQTGKVTGVTAGVVTITATSTADASKAASSVITVSSAGGPVAPQVSISTVNQGGVPAVLTNVAGQLDVTLLATGGAGTIELFLAPAANCTSNTIAATDIKVATQNTVASQSGPITLSFNTAAVLANKAQFPNGQYCIKSRLTTATGTAIATNTIPLTLNNINVFTAALQFASQTGGPTSAVSTLNGLNYNQGTLTATITPVIFTSASPVALISGSLSLVGEQGGVAVASAIPFTNLAVTNGVATIVFTDTSATGVNSIYQYTSGTAGSNLTISSATDAAGNPITIGVGSVTGATGIRIDNDIPLNTGALYTVNAPNGYVGNAYLFSSGTTGTAASDTRGGVQGVGGVTTTYWVGAAGSAAFTTANSCDVTALTAATSGASLANTVNTTTDAVKVVVSDALGNKVCQDVVVTTNGGPSATFGVDKIVPIASMVTTNNGASNNTGYNVTKNFSFVYNDSGSAGFNPTQPLIGTLTRNFFTAGVGTAADCLIGTYSATPKTCVAAPITVTSTFGTPPTLGGSVEFTNGTLTPGYYTIVASAIDQANNTGATLTRIAAYDNVAPAVAAPTQQSPNPVAPLAAATVAATATDNFDLSTYKGNLVYATAPNPFQGPAAGSFGTTFDATYVTSGTATVSLPNVYRGLQNTAGGIVAAAAATPTATVTVTDVGTNSATSSAVAIATTTASVDILTSTAVTFAVAPTSAAPSTAQASTTITVNLSGSVTDIPFQSQPFATVEVYKVVSGELVKVASIAQTVGTYTTTANATTRFYTYVIPSIALTSSTSGPTVNTFYVVGVAPTGNAVISPAIVVTNPTA